MADAGIANRGAFMPALSRRDIVAGLAAAGAGAVVGIPAIHGLAVAASAQTPVELTGRLVFPDIADPESFRSAIWGRTPGPGAAAPAEPPAAGTFAGSVEISAAARLAEVEGLYKRGLLSDEEYTRKREEILKAL